MNQDQRRLTMDLLLSIKASQYTAWATGLTADEVDILKAQEPAVFEAIVQINRALVRAYYARTRHDLEMELALVLDYTRVIAYLNDDNLFRLVELVTGRPPF